MRIVDRKTFLAMPANTLFAKYEPCSFDALEIKGDSLPNDFLAQEIAGAIDCKNSDEFVNFLESAEQDGNINIPMNFNAQYRDGCFDDDQLFAVFEEKDVKALIERLQKCLPNEI